ncbi:hypothetical protein EON77_16690 [bacterium]|nr:MAG: hypothetical protein EON77_16690 [bacterium]
MDAATSSERRRALAASMIRRQSSLSTGIATVFLAVLVLLPLVNLYLPEVASGRVGGFTLSWLLLGVLFYPFVIVLSMIFVRRSDRIEREIVSEVRREEKADAEAAVRGPKFGERPTEEGA